MAEGFSKNISFLFFFITENVLSTIIWNFRLVVCVQNYKQWQYVIAACYFLMYTPLWYCRSLQVLATRRDKIAYSVHVEGETLSLEVCYYVSCQFNTLLYTFQGNGWKSDSLCLLELLSVSFNLTKFHPNRRDSLCHACLVLSRLQS